MIKETFFISFIMIILFFSFHKGGMLFYIILNQELPKEVTSYKAKFEGVGKVPLDVVNNFNLTGIVPGKQVVDSQNVKLKEKSKFKLLHFQTFVHLCPC